MLSNEMTAELIDGLLDIFGQNVQKIILYGSVARKEETEDSDVDIAVILERAFDEATREKFFVWSSELDLKYGKVVSIIDIEKKNLDKWGRILPFYRNVFEEGVVLWQAA